MTRFRLFHNHLTVNLVTAIFPPATDEWNRLAARVRAAVFEAAAREGVDLILTRAPRTADEAEVARVLAMLEPVRQRGGSALFVHLHCERDELRRRVQAEGRAEHGKLTHPAGLDHYDTDARLPLEPHLSVDTTHQSPQAVAELIARSFDLIRR
jgi:hypothetical protein